jgi:glucose/arabinose dehydrogenase
VFTEGFEFPIGIAAAPNDPNTLYVVERKGRITAVDLHTRTHAPFLEFTDQVLAQHFEQGLLALVFHPKFSENGYFYIYYSKENSDTVLSRFHVAPGQKAVEAEDETILLVIDQPTLSLNGGSLVFGPNDGYLYLTIGDGGPSSRPDDRAQDLTRLLGKVLRLDVDSAFPYAIPTDNPFVDVENARDEIWAYGLRNPWRLAFDPITGDAFIGDVGKDSREELNVQPGTSIGGENYGWPLAEGFACVGGNGTCGTQSGLIPPLLDYTHQEIFSIIGGYVYRGAAKSFGSAYIFGDFVTGRVWTLRYADGTYTDYKERTSELGPQDFLSYQLSAFGEDTAGNLYMCAYRRGLVYRLHIGPDDYETSDVDHDGLTNLVDLQLVIQAVLELYDGAHNLDVNGDEKVNIRDVYEIVGTILERM